MNFARLFDLLRDLRGLLLPCLLAAAVWGAWRSQEIELDMSFRPLFEADPEAVSRAEAFEATFGGTSGSRIGALFVGAPVPDGLVEEVARIDHLSRGQVAQAPDGEASALWVRVDLPLADLVGRRPAIDAFRKAVGARAPPATEVHFVGVSVVEDAYADIVLNGLAVSVISSTIVILLLLVATFGHVRDALIATSGLALALPITFGAMAALGQSLTVVNSMVATLVLVIGVADAIHMLSAFHAQRACGLAAEPAARAMMNDTGFACLMTTVTTAAGFLSLGFASLEAIRDFGVIVAIGVTSVYVANLVTIPNLLVRYAPPLRRAPTIIQRCLGAVRAAVRGCVLRKPGWTAAGVSLVFLLGILGIPRLEARQKFNEEVAPSHPIRVGQALVEKHFGGFLGPELVLRRRDGEAPRAEDVRAFQEALAGHPDVTHVEALGLRGDQAGLAVRTPDVGTKRAGELVEFLEGSAASLLPAYRVEVVGPWWLAQRGMANLIGDLVRCFAGACLLVLPFLGLFVRDLRLFLIGLLPNVLPLAFALGLMAWTGLSLRIGTAMILAIALGIAVDDTLHLILRLRRERAEGKTAVEAVESTLEHTGLALLVTSLILAAGFASMVPNELLAIRDMGLIGAMVMLAALSADVLLAPALYLLAFRPSLLRMSSPRSSPRTLRACGTPSDSRPS